MEKITAEICNGPHIRQLMTDSNFASQMTERNQQLLEHLSFALRFPGQDNSGLVCHCLTPSSSTN